MLTGDSILIIDDNEDIRAPLKTMLEFEGLNAIAAKGGREALDILESGTPISLILLDLAMPEMDGFEFLRVLHQQEWNPKVPVIVFSGTDMSNLELPTDVIDCVPKPFRFGEVLEKIRPLRKERTQSFETDAHFTHESRNFADINSRVVPPTQRR